MVLNLFLVGSQKDTYFPLKDGAKWEYKNGEDKVERTLNEIGEGNFELEISYFNKNGEVYFSVIDTIFSLQNVIFKKSGQNLIEVYVPNGLNNGNQYSIFGIDYTVVKIHDYFKVNDKVYKNVMECRSNDISIGHRLYFAKNIGLIQMDYNGRDVEELIRYDLN